MSNKYVASMSALSVGDAILLARQKIDSFDTIDIKLAALNVIQAADRLLAEPRSHMADELQVAIVSWAKAVAQKAAK